MSLVVDDVPVKYIAGQQTTLDEHKPALPMWAKLFLRWIYRRYGWAAIEGFQFRGSFDQESDARWAANCKGGWYRSVPYNAALPEETCQFGVYDHPQDQSEEYRNRQLPFVAIRRTDLEALGATIEQTAECAEGLCEKA